MDSELRGKIPDFFFEQEALGEYSGKRDLRAFEDEINRIKSENKSFRDQYPSTLFLQRAKEKQKNNQESNPKTKEIKSTFISESRVDLFRRVKQWLSKPWFIPGLAGALLAAVIIPLVLLSDPLPYTGIKGSGDPSLQVYLKTDMDPVNLEPGAPLTQGDLIQVTYNSAGRNYGMIVSLDGRGSTFLHLHDAEKSVKLIQNGAVNLPYSYELDDAPTFERFYFYTSDQSFDYQLVEEHLRRGAALPQFIDFTQIEFTKE
jgi:hypothetical protein